MVNVDITSLSVLEHNPKLLILVLVGSLIGSLYQFTKKDEASTFFKKIMDLLLGLFLGIVAGVKSINLGFDLPLILLSTVIFATTGTTLLDIVFRLLPSIASTLVDKYLNKFFGITLYKDKETQTHEQNTESKSDL